MKKLKWSEYGKIEITVKNSAIFKNIINRY